MNDEVREVRPKKRKYGIESSKKRTKGEAVNMMLSTLLEESDEDNSDTEREGLLMSLRAEKLDINLE